MLCEHGSILKKKLWSPEAQFRSPKHGPIPITGLLPTLQKKRVNIGK
jgi:hypothetical protein